MSLQIRTVPRSAAFKDSAQDPFKFLTRCLDLKKYINPNLNLLPHRAEPLERGDAPEQIKYYKDKTEFYTIYLTQTH